MHKGTCFNPATIVTIVYRIRAIAHAGISGGKLQGCYLKREVQTVTDGYLARIEFPGDESGESYRRLHLEMGKREFTRWFLSVAEAGRFELPHATYVHEGFHLYRSVQAAYHAASEVASAIDPGARVIVLEKGEAVYGP